MRLSNSVKSLKKFTGLAAALMVLPVAVACSTKPADTTVNTPTSEAPTTGTAATTTPNAVGSDSMANGDTIVDVASANGSFSTLVSAIKAAGLTDTLSAAGPYTVFAPTDAAFAALPEGTLDKLLKPENQEVLTQVLKYHVVPEKLMASDIKPGMVPTVEGKDLDITDNAGKVMVNGKAVEQADITASNGIIHSIDAVLLPPSLDLSTLK